MIRLAVFVIGAPVLAVARAIRSARRPDISTHFLDRYRPRPATTPPAERPQCACARCTADRARAVEFAAAVMETVLKLELTHEGDPR